MLFTPFHRNTDEQHMASLSNLRFSVHLIGLSLFFVRFFPSLSSSLHHTFSVTAFLCLLLTRCFDCCHIALPLFSNIISSSFFFVSSNLCVFTQLLLPCLDTLFIPMYDCVATLYLHWVVLIYSLWENHSSILISPAPSSIYCFSSYTHWHIW